MKNRSKTKLILRNTNAVKELLRNEILRGVKEFRKIYETLVYFTSVNEL